MVQFKQLINQKALIIVHCATWWQYIDIAHIDLTEKMTLRHLP